MRLAACTLVALALTAVPALAQPVDGRTVADRVTGLDEPPPGMEVGLPAIPPGLMNDYMRALEAVNMAVEVETRGATRGALGFSRLKVNARWESRPGASSPVLAGLEILPQGGTLDMGGMRVRKVTIDARGRMKLDIAGYPDVTVSRISRNRDGDIRLHLDWLPDITIRRNGEVSMWGFIGLGRVGTMSDAIGANWPPRLEDVVRVIEDATATPPAPSGGARPATGGAPAGGGRASTGGAPAGGGAGTTSFDAVVRWDVRATSSPFRSDALGDVPTAAAMRLRGAGEVRPDGAFRTIGDENTVRVDLTVGARSIETGPVTADVRSARATLDGRYGLVVPANGGALALEVDGRVDWDIHGDAVRVHVPDGARVRAAEVRTTGGGRLTARVGGAGDALVLRDGTYALDVRGPMGISGLRTDRLTIDDLGLDGAVHAEGSVAMTGNRVTFDGSASTDVEVVGAGIVETFGMERGTSARARVERGSRIAADLDAARLDLSMGEASAPGPVGAPVVVDAAGRGRVEAGLDLSDVRIVARDGGFEGGRVRIDGALGVDGSVAGGLTEGSGRATVRLDDDARVSATGLARDEASGTVAAAARTHEIVRGDTLSRLAARYGTTVAALKAENGLASDTIHVGRTLRIPGGTTRVVTRPADRSGHLTTTLAAGSTATLDVASARTLEDGSFELTGRVSSRVVVSTTDVAAGLLEARILGAARASLDGDLRLRVANGEARVSTGRLEVPVRLDLAPGSRLAFGMPGRRFETSLDRPGSYAEFVAVCRVVDGRLELDELARVDLLLVSSADLGIAEHGVTVGVHGDKTVRYAGRVVLRDRGVDLFGEVSVGVRGGDDRPIVRIDW